jgi:hypothetical protein
MTISEGRGGVFAVPPETARSTASLRWLVLLLRRFINRCAQVMDSGSAWASISAMKRSVRHIGPVQYSGKLGISRLIKRIVNDSGGGARTLLVPGSSAYRT